MDVDPKRRTLASRVFVALLCCLLAGITVATMVSVTTENTLLSVVIGLFCGVVVGLFLVPWAVAPLYKQLKVLRNGADSLRDRDFSVRLAEDGKGEVGALVEAFNDVIASLQQERHDLYQRELLLDTIIQSSPMAIVLTDPKGRFRFVNRTAKRLFSISIDDASRPFAEILERCPSALAEALADNEDTLVTMGLNEGAETFHVAQRTFTLNAQPHCLYLFRPMTKEVAREQVAIWKRVIRLISHELNNSLAPVSSLVHSARKAASLPQGRQKQNELFGAIQERVDHLVDFLRSYAEFARLPDPVCETVSVDAFVNEIRPLYPFQVHGALPSEPLSFDAAQLQQVLINLIKNAHEAGSPQDEVALSISVVGQRVVIRVTDRGSGMDASQLSQATIPFYSTRLEGQGLGLALCREILERHGGRLSLRNRMHGGLCVTCTLPRNPAVIENAQSVL